MIQTMNHVSVLKPCSLIEYKRNNKIEIYFADVL